MNVITKSFKKIKESTKKKIKAALEAEDYTFILAYNDGRGIRFQSICPNGHDYEAYWWGFHREGKRCKQCYSEQRMPTLDHIKQCFEERGLIPLFSTCKNSKTKLPYQCKRCGFKHQINWNCLQQGHGCSECAGNKKYTYQQIKSFVERQKHVLLSKEYKGSHDRLKVQCLKGKDHIYDVSWTSFQQGSRCPYCAGNKALTYQQVKAFIEQQRHTLLSKHYKNARTILSIECDKGCQYEMSWANFKTGNRCPYCAGKKTTYDRVKKYIEQQGHKLLSKTYKGAHIKLHVQCPKKQKHQYWISWSNFQQGHRCPKCANHQSKGELEIIEYLKSKGVYVIERNRSILGGKELDIFIPNKEWVESNKASYESKYCNTSI